MPTSFAPGHFFTAAACRMEMSPAPTNPTPIVSLVRGIRGSGDGSEPELYRPRAAQASAAFLWDRPPACPTMKSVAAPEHLRALFRSPRDAGSEVWARRVRLEHPEDPLDPLGKDVQRVRLADR